MNTITFVCNPSLAFFTNLTTLKCQVNFDLNIVKILIIHHPPALIVIIDVKIWKKFLPQ